MTEKKVSPDLINILSKTVIHQAQRVKELWSTLLEPSATQSSIEHFDQAIFYYVHAAEQFNDLPHIEIANQIKNIRENGSKQTLDEVETRRINEIIQKLKQLGLRESDLVDTSQNRKKKPVYFFAGEHSNKNKELLEKLQQFNIQCTWIGTESLPNPNITTDPSLFLFDCNLLKEEHYANFLTQRAKQKNQINIALYNRTFPPAEIRTKVLKANADLLDIYDFPELIRTLNKKSHLKKDTDICLFLLQSEAHESANIQRYLENSSFNLITFTKVENLIEELNEQQVDAVIITPEAYQLNQLPIAQLIKQQSTQIHLPIINIDTNPKDKKDHNQPLIGTQVDDNCDLEKFKLSLLKQIDQSEILKNLISQDRLTGLYTHSFFLNKARLALKKHTDSDMTLIMIDIDHFKSVNDQYGHQVGDSVIQNLSLYLRQNLRYNDPVGRYGGEEFAVLLDTDENQALNVIDKIRAGFSEFEHTHTTSFKITFSCGLASWKNQGLEKLVEQADSALYQAKQQGRNCCKIYNHKES